LKSVQCHTPDFGCQSWWHKRDRSPPAVAHVDDERMVDEIKGDLERAVAVGCHLHSQ